MRGFKYKAKGTIIYQFGEAPCFISIQEVTNHHYSSISKFFINSVGSFEIRKGRNSFINEQNCRLYKPKELRRENSHY